MILPCGIDLLEVGDNAYHHVYSELRRALNPARRRLLGDSLGAWRAMRCDVMRCLVPQTAQSNQQEKASADGILYLGKGNSEPPPHGITRHQTATRGRAPFGRPRRGAVAANSKQ